MIRTALIAATAVLMFNAAQTDAANASDVFNANTMQGWQRNTGAAAMAYGYVPFHAAASERKQAHLGFAMTAPVGGRGTHFALHTQAPRFVDLRLTGSNVPTGWAATLRTGSTPVWSNDPAVHHLFENGTTWAAVGALTVAAGIGIFAIIERDVPPPTTTNSGSGGS